LPPSEPIGTPEPWIKGRTAVYHITHVSNLASIVSGGQLDCVNQCAAKGIEPASIAYAGIKAQRARTAVTVARGGTLADYVPFYYAPRSPMLYANHYYGGVADAPGGQASIVHLVSSVEVLAEAGKFVVTDGKPTEAVTVQYGDLGGLDSVDWAVMPLKMWNDTDEAGDRKRRRQAEFLVHAKVPFSAFCVVGVLDLNAAGETATALAEMPDPPAVRIRPDWYY
jgi:ssDNA thymidine ADP-ribosyltransferase, DarT